MTSEPIAIAILAGGEGRRIGGQKPSVKLGSMTLLERAAERAAGWSEQICIVVRSSDQLPVGIAQLTDLPDVEGPLGGLAAGLEWAEAIGARFLLTIPCDMPFLPDNLPWRLAKEIGNASVAIAASNSRLHPVCGLWRSKLSPLIGDYVASGRRSLRGFAELAGFVEVNWLADHIDPFFNINTPSDLRSARSTLND